MGLLSALYNLGETLSKNTTTPDIYMERAYKERKTGDNKTAIELYDQAISAGRETWVAYFYRGECKLDTGDTKGAIADFTRATEIDPKHSKQAKAALEKAQAILKK